VRTLSRVLCAVDIDDVARTTFRQALAIARPRHAKLLLVCAVPPEETFKHRAADRAGYLMRLRREAEAAGVDVHATVQRGDVAEIVLLHAASRRADLIVISVEHGRAHGHAWGAIAEDVLRSAPCPTLVVPAGALEQPSFDRVLSAVDLDTGPLPSIEEMLQLASARDARLTTLHVAKSRTAASSTLAKGRSLISGSFKSIARSRVAIGAVVKEVLKAARAMAADLIVIGARRRNRVGRRLFGVTRQLLTLSVCPVLAIPVRTAAVRPLERQAA